MKVYELAKDLNLKSVQLLDKLRKEHNMAVKNHMQNLSAEEVQKIKSFFQTDQKALPKKPVVKKRKPLIKKPIQPTEEVAQLEKKPVIRTGVIRRRGRPAQAKPQPQKKSSAKKNRE